MAAITEAKAYAVDRMNISEYHAHEAISNSKLSEFIESPELFHGRYVTKKIPPKETTAAMEFGTLFHDAVLLGIENAAIEIPDEVLSKSGSKAGAGWKAFCEHYADLNKPMLKREEFAALKNMVDAVMSNPLGERLLNRAGSIVEQSIFWTDPTTGLNMRARLDHRSPYDKLISDLKTTVDISRRGIASTMYDFGYYRQAATYKIAAHAYTGDPYDFAFCFAEKTPPHRVRWYELDPRPERALTKAYEDVRDGLDRLAVCYETNNWREFGYDQILTLDLPNWAYTDQWELADGNSTEG